MPEKSTLGHGTHLLYPTSTSTTELAAKKRATAVEFKTTLFQGIRSVKYTDYVQKAKYMQYMWANHSEH